MNTIRIFLQQVFLTAKIKFLSAPISTLNVPRKHENINFLVCVGFLIRERYKKYPIYIFRKYETAIVYNIYTVLKLPKKQNHFGAKI